MASRGLSLPKEVRLRRSSEIVEVIRKGKIFRERDFSLFLLFKGEGPMRFGCIVPKRVGTAPKRNRIKRLVREVFRLNRGRLKEGFWMIVLVKQGAEGDSLRSWWERLEKVWREAGVMREDEEGSPSSSDLL